MADGRLFTDYRPKCAAGFVPAPQKGLFLDSYKYRQHLIGNAADIMEELRADSYDTAVCAPCDASHGQAGTMLPERTMQKCNGRTCTFVANDPNGLGLGRAYEASPYQVHSKKQFLADKARERAYYKKNANCCSTARDDLAYNPVDPTMVHRHPTGRLTVPYGGMAMTGGDASVVRSKE